MHALEFILISSIISCCAAVKCFRCVNADGDACNSGQCDGDWCVAKVITRNPFIASEEKRVTKTCESANPNGFNNDSCVSSIDSNGRKLTCGCQRDFCNDDSAMQKLPVVKHEGTEKPPGPKLNCVCDENDFCIDNQCKGDACTTKVYDETGTMANGGGVRIGIRVAKGCAAFMPTDLVNSATTTVETVDVPGRKSVQAKVTTVYCNNRDFCNASERSRTALPLFILLVLVIFSFVLV